MNLQEVNPREGLQQGHLLENHLRKENQQKQDHIPHQSRIIHQMTIKRPKGIFHQL